MNIFTSTTLMFPGAARISPRSSRPLSWPKPCRAVVGIAGRDAGAFQSASDLEKKRWGKMGKSIGCSPARKPKRICMVFIFFVVIFYDVLWLLEMKPTKRREFLWQTWGYVRICILGKMMAVGKPLMV